jgi:large subunit ribosomal protein L10
MPTPTKVAKVQELKEQLTESAASLISDYRGITVKDVTELRAALQEAEATFTVVKNTLTKLAAVEAGFAELEAILEGPTAITFVKGDVVIAAKRLADAAKRIPSLEIKGAVMEGQVISADQARALATLESREVLLAKMAGMAKASMSRAAYAFNAIQSKFLSVLEAYREKLPPGEAPAPEPEETPAAEVEEAPAAEKAAAEAAPTSSEAGAEEPPAAGEPADTGEPAAGEPAAAEQPAARDAASEPGDGTSGGELQEALVEGLASAPAPVLEEGAETLDAQEALAAELSEAPATVEETPAEEPIEAPSALAAETEPEEAEAAEEAGPTETESPDEAEAAEDAGPSETEPPQEDDAAQAATQSDQREE